MKKEKLSTRYGFEFSYISHKETTKEFKNSSMYSLLSTSLEKNAILQQNISSICSDACVEIQTIPTDNLKEIISYYRYINSIVTSFSEITKEMVMDSHYYSDWNRRQPKFWQDFNLQPRIEGLCGGGLHMWLDIPFMKKATNSRSYPTHTTKSLLFISNMVNFISNNHYISWLFNDPCDDYNATLIYKEDSWQKFIFDKDEDVLPDGSKDVAITTGGGNKSLMEFRFFEMCKDEKELLLYINFIEAIFQYIYKVTQKGHEISMDVYFPKHLKKFTYSYIRSEFPLLLEKLGLSISDYKRYYAKYKERVDIYGKEALT